MDESGGLIQRSVKRTGFRTIELVQDRDSIGAQFNFRVNGHSIFIKGCNVVPPNLLVSESMDSTWVALVRMMQAASMNMARIWAGGVYPPDAFFDACDTAGILVWQDFMVGNMVPGGRDFLDNVSIEASEQLGRLRHHPSLALLCGDNELAVAWENWGWQQRYALHGVDSIRIKDDYDELHRRLGIDTRYVGIDYTPTSPLSNWGSTAGLRSGDLHYWGVWHGDSTFSSFQNNVGRFVSEWGFQSYPDSALLAKYIHPDSLYLGSPAVKRLQRSYKTDRPIWEAIERELEEERPTTLGGFIEASQRAQAKATRWPLMPHGCPSALHGHPALATERLLAGTKLEHHRLQGPSEAGVRGGEGGLRQAVRPGAPGFQQELLTGSCPGTVRRSQKTTFGANSTDLNPRPCLDLDA